MSDSDDERFAKGSTFLTDHNELLTVAGARVGKHGRIIKFAEAVDRDDAESLRGRTLTIGASQRRELDESEYWPEQLVGLAVFSTDGIECGTVADVVFGEAQDRLVLDTAGGIVEVPFVDELVPDVDLVGGRVLISPIAGLLSGEES